MKKRPKKHHFVHKDPERKAAERSAEKPSGTETASKRKDTGGYTTESISTDLRRTAVMIGIFIAILIILYIIQTKTGALQPILKKFGL